MPINSNKMDSASSPIYRLARIKIQKGLELAVYERLIIWSCNRRKICKEIKQNIILSILSFLVSCVK